MYFKVFESRETASSYLLRYIFDREHIGAGKLTIENEKHEIINIDENELYCLLNEFFKQKKKNNDS